MSSEAKSRRIDPRTVALEPWPLDPETIVEGAPEVSGLVLDESADGSVQRGIWQHSVGSSRDIEADELFVVVFGRATIEIEGRPTLEVGPGDVGLLSAGDRTLWHVHETLRKVYQAST